VPLTADRIEVVEYDERWPRLFAETAAPLRIALGDAALRIDHIGSTAVPGLAAKPVIDIQISVASLDALDAFRLPLESLGYVHQPDNPELTKRFFREPFGLQRTHVHVRAAGSFGEQFALLFRDYLRAHESVANEYAALKKQLARELADDREAYTEAKSPFIWDVMRRADAWAQEVGWKPGASDA
jgi:GrpB-like predicted nucleotidyltransferase (UPF0157 family)